MTSEPTQLPCNEVTTRSPDDKSAFSKNHPVPATPNHDQGPSHVTDDDTAARAKGVSTACSRSSSRSSGFDENSSTVTDCSLFPITVAHAHDGRPEMTSSEMAEDVGSGVENVTTKNKDDDAGGPNALQVSADSRVSNDNNVAQCENQPTGGDHQQDSCSSQAKEDRPDAIMKELDRQIQNMSERFNTLLARVKSSELAELSRSTVSLKTGNESPPRTRQTSSMSSDDFTHRPPLTAAESKYSRNTAYRRLISAKSGFLPETDMSRTRRPITAADDVVVTTDDAPADHVAASSALIGQQTGDNVATAAEGGRSSVAATEFDDVVKSASTDDVTSQTDDSRSPRVDRNHVFGARSTESSTYWSEVDAGKAERVTNLRREVDSDFETIFRPIVGDQEPTVPSEERRTLKAVHQHSWDALEPDRTQASRSVDVGDHKGCVAAPSDHPFRRQPRRTSVQSEDVFVEEVPTTPTWSMGREVGTSPRRLLPAIPPRRSASTRPSDEFHDDRSWSSASSQTSFPVSRTPRLRPAGSYDSLSLPRLSPTRRRFFLTHAVVTTKIRRLPKLFRTFESF